jgi:hypothetical protein
MLRSPSHSGAGWTCVSEGKTLVVSCRGMRIFELSGGLDNRHPSPLGIDPIRSIGGGHGRMDHFLRVFGLDRECIELQHSFQGQDV